jgi:predicted Zn-dependent protease with MMP-like domain
MVAVELERFEALVADALDRLPDSLGRTMENVAIIIDEESPPGRLLGLYEGVPLTARGISYSGVMPDRITIFMRTICSLCQDESDVIETVRRTVIHEVAHHFGIGDARLHELGWG